MLDDTYLIWKLIYVEGGKPENPEKNPQSQIEINQSAHNSGRSGGGGTDHFFFLFFSGQYFYFYFLQNLFTVNSKVRTIRTDYYKHTNIEEGAINIYIFYYNN